MGAGWGAGFRLLSGLHTHVLILQFSCEIFNTPHPFTLTGVGFISFALRAIVSFISLFIAELKHE